MQLEEKELSRELQANERTFLAWLRTGLGIMAMGFVVVKFSFFIRQFALLTHHPELANTDPYAEWLGTLLVLVGVALVPLAYLRFRRKATAIIEHRFIHTERLPMLISIVTTLIGVFLLTYLFLLF